VGLVHHRDDRPDGDDLARRLPLLDDRAVAETVTLAAAYQAIRQALLALSGIAMAQSLGRASPTALAGVIATSRTSVGCARDALARPVGSASAPVQVRARLLARACDLLDEQLAVLVGDGHAEVPWRLLDDVRRVLATTSLVAAGMRQYGSTGCSAYLGLAGPPHQHPHPHPH
jgi:hypothetical protein